MLHIVLAYRSSPSMYGGAYRFIHGVLLSCSSKLSHTVPRHFNKALKVVENLLYFTRARGKRVRDRQLVD